MLLSRAQARKRRTPMTTLDAPQPPCCCRRCCYCYHCSHCCRHCRCRCCCCCYHGWCCYCCCSFLFFFFVFFFFLLLPNLFCILLLLLLPPPTPLVSTARATAMNTVEENAFPAKSPRSTSLRCLQCAMSISRNTPWKASFSAPVSNRLRKTVEHDQRQRRRQRQRQRQHRQQASIAASIFELLVSRRGEGQ